MCIFFRNHKTDKIKHPDFGKIKVTKHSDTIFDLTTNNISGCTWLEDGKIWFVQFAFGKQVFGTIDQNTHIMQFVDSSEVFDGLFNINEKEEVLVSIGFLTNSKSFGKEQYTIEFSRKTPLICHEHSAQNKDTSIELLIVKVRT